MPSWLRDCSFILLAFAIWLVSVALPPAATVQANGAQPPAPQLQPAVSQSDAGWPLP